MENILRLEVDTLYKLKRQTLLRYTVACLVIQNKIQLKKYQFSFPAFLTLPIKYFDLLYTQMRRNISRTILWKNNVSLVAVQLVSSGI